MGVWFLIATHMAMAGQAVKPGPTVQSDHSYTIGHGDVAENFYLERTRSFRGSGNGTSGWKNYLSPGE